jgi:hypothetical protein
MRIWTSSLLSIQLQQTRTLKDRYFAEHFYLGNHNCKLIERFPHLELLYLDLRSIRKTEEINGWSADRTEKGLRDINKVLLDKEKVGLKVVATKYTSPGWRGRDILHPVCGTNSVIYHHL